MPTLPGGQIIGGVGGRIWSGDYRKSRIALQNILTNTAPYLLQAGRAQPYVGGLIGLEVSEWRLSIHTNLAQCPHTGTYGANCRRIVLDDWSFSGSCPADLLNTPDMNLTAMDGNQRSSHTQNISLAFMLGNVQINPEAVYMGMTQSWYYAPSAYLQTANPVLNAAGDVIRMSFSGEGCGHLFLLPLEQAWCDRYLAYLDAMGWGGE